jgi:AcrR family transcriptional regulator
MGSHAGTGRRLAQGYGGSVVASNGTKASQGDLAARCVSAAARWIYQGRRVDMQGLADELGVSRVTLFRRIGSRDELISQALWRLSERILALVRLGESLLYVEALAARKPDADATSRLQQALIEGITP